MRVIVEVSREVAEKVAKLVAAGKFNSLPEFIQISINNQLFLEESEEGEVNLRLKPLGPPNQSAQAPQILVQRSAVSDLLNLNPRGYDNIKTLPAPPVESLELGPLWGQYNRIFPVKLVVRVLANLVLQRQTPLDLEEFGELAAEVARGLGHKLRDIDKAERRETGEKLATALPIGSDPYKSRARFTRQFVGYVDGRGRMIGAAPKLGLVSIIDLKSPRIGITAEGLQFAKIPNPLLDSTPRSGASLSLEEAAFYVTHVRRFAPAEYGIMLLVMRSIDKGTNSPEALTKIAGRFNTSWTEVQADTMRGGLVGRLSELDLISVIRSGRKITYELTADGQAVVTREKDD